MVLTSCPDGYLCLDVRVYHIFLCESTDSSQLGVSQTTCVVSFLPMNNFG